MYDPFRQGSLYFVSVYELSIIGCLMFTSQVPLELDQGFRPKHDVHIIYHPRN